MQKCSVFLFSPHSMNYMSDRAEGYLTCIGVSRLILNYNNLFLNVSSCFTNYYKKTFLS